MTEFSIEDSFVSFSRKRRTENYFTLLINQIHSNLSYIIIGIFFLMVLSYSSGNSELSVNSRSEFGFHQPNSNSPIPLRHEHSNAARESTCQHTVQGKIYVIDDRGISHNYYHPYGYHIIN